jgi:SpoVK/Ycf46/Vps4 family AAA+-type ATPase
LKTLTAEALAETLKRPIYYLTVGELGTNVEELETKLKDVLEIAETWNAILLIDEIDIFVQKRGGNSDINRNAMTGVFLRLLEYYSGIMFLTTNLVENLDPAFLSRISLNVDYGSTLTDATREQIWLNLTRNVTIENFDAKALSTIKINGRRIKNSIKLLLSLSTFKGLKPTQQMLLDIINLSEGKRGDGYHATSGI